MDERIREFYEHDYLEKLKLTAPLEAYLQAEEEQIKCAFRDCKHESVLEVGSGTGRLIPIICPLVRRYTGIEACSRSYYSSIALYWNFWGKVTLIHGDAGEYRFLPEEYDYALFAWNTFGNLYRERDKVLTHVMQAIKPGGAIFLSVLSEKVLKTYLQMVSQSRFHIQDVTGDYVFLWEGLVSERFTIEKLQEIAKTVDALPIISPLTDIGYWCELRK